MSEIPRFFVPEEMSLDAELVVVQGEALHHMRDVLRLREGARLLLLDGTGLCCEVVIERVDRQQAEARAVRRWRSTETAFPVEIIQALPKGDKFDLVLQKGTELGVTAFQPVTSLRSISRADKARLAQRILRWQRIIREAARQSRRSVLPALRPVQALSEVLGEATPYLKLALWEAGAQPLAELLPSQPPAGVMLLIGPEGGLSDEEVALASSAGFRPVHLGPRIMRTETAGLAVTPILQYLYGDWQKAPSDQQL